LRIAFVSPNREQLPDPVVPLGLLYMMAVAGERHEKTLIDLCFEDAPLDALAARLDDFAPDVVAISMRNIQNADYTGTSSTLGYYDDVVRVVRERTTAPVVMGGGGFSIIPGDLVRRFGLDYGIAGEGERAFAELLSRIEAGSRDASGIAHVYGPDGRPFSPVRPMGRHDFLNIRENVRPERQWVSPRYYEHSGISSIQTKRGCAMKCDYCTYPTIEGRTIRQRWSDDVADEWQHMARSSPDISHVFVVDAVFNLPPEHARQVCRSLIARDVHTPWTCYLNPIKFDQDLADLMARAGCAGVEIGSDSGTDEGLARLRKGFTTEQIRRTSAACRQAGIKDCHTFVLGVPGETVDDVERSLDFIEALDPYSAILMAYKDDHEAVDDELAQRLGAFRQLVLEAIERRARHRPRWAVPSIGLRFNHRLFNVLRKSGLRGPLWQHVM
jgi:Fe-S oxidoreductase